MPKEEWKTKANEAILLLEEAGFLMAEKALGKDKVCRASTDLFSAQATNESGFIEVHQHFENSALQVASVLPAGADLPDQESFVTDINRLRLFKIESDVIDYES